MNRQEFIDEMQDMSDLKRFDYDYDCGMLCDIYDRDTYNDWVWDSIRDWCDGWESLGDWLCNLPSPYDYDYYDTSDEVCGVGDWEFNYWKEKMLDYLDYSNFWDEEGYACDEMPDFVPPVQEDDGQLLMLLSVC